ncbi:MAG: sensor domain-containing diguanylate cyclase [Treponema sp.]|jgi:diguanylate cyclase (GGDEF)-like protein|nr:sensor domain-containing diguanylate cyclase [Treponema sp.]
MADNAENFLLNPKIVENYSFLQNIGVFKYIEELNQEIRHFKRLLSGAAEIFNRTSIDDIINATVWQISDQFIPSFIVFLWKPYQNKPDVIIRAYKNYKLVDLTVDIDSIIYLEPFFRQNPQSISYKILRQYIKDTDGDNPVTAALDELSPELVIPILGPSGGLYGIILIGAKMLADSYSELELDFLNKIMSFVSQAIQNHLHYERSVRDIKTGLFNHGFFITRLSEEIAHATRGERESSLIAIDVDQFKLFNDNYGHLAGDKVLEYIAMVIKQSVRMEDVPSRFGGEEFNILLPNTDRNTALIVAERVRKAVAAMEVPWSPSLPQVTISLGVFTFNEHTKLPADEILHRADEALYRSKTNGRNRTTVSASQGLYHKARQIENGKKAIEKTADVEEIQDTEAR